MIPSLTIALIYLSGVVVAAFFLRWYNAKQEYKYNCGPPQFCLLSWFGVAAAFVTVLVHYAEKYMNRTNYSCKSIEKFFYYTDKK